MKKFIQFLLCFSFVFLLGTPINAQENSPIEIEAIDNTAIVSFEISDNPNEITVTTPIYSENPNTRAVVKYGTLYTTLRPLSNTLYCLDFQYKKDPSHKSEWYALGFNVIVRGSNILDQTVYTNQNIYMRTNTIDSNIYKKSNPFQGKAGKTVTLQFSNCYIDRYNGGRIYTMPWNEGGFRF